MMNEAQAVAEALGIRFRISLEKRLAGAEAVGAHKTSMLQDIEAGRGIEADALMGSVIELGRIAGVPTPQIEVRLCLCQHCSSTTIANQKRTAAHLDQLRHRAAEALGTQANVYR